MISGKNVFPMVSAVGSANASSLDFLDSIKCEKNTQVFSIIADPWNGIEKDPFLIAIKAEDAYAGNLDLSGRSPRPVIRGLR